MIPNFQNYSNKILGSSLSLPAHGWVGARAISSLAAHFALQNTLSKFAEKKASPSSGEAEGGCGGNSAFAASFFAAAIFRISLYEMRRQEFCLIVFIKFGIIILKA
ncbi:hypothetical protein KKF09_02970 [Patescibacteria group bacterium]|nr:hypothetical protein [Patescibacteria group bacterium]